MSNLNIATGGWLYSPLAIATAGYQGFVITLPDNVTSKSVLDVAFSSGTKDLVFFEVGEELRVQLVVPDTLEIPTNGDLLTKTVDFINSNFCLELESFSKQELKFKSSRPSVELGKFVNEPMGIVNIDHT